MIATDGGRGPLSVAEGLQAVLDQRCRFPRLGLLDLDAGDLDLADGDRRGGRLHGTNVRGVDLQGADLQPAFPGGPRIHSLAIENGDSPQLAMPPRQPGQDCRVWVRCD